MKLEYYLWMDGDKRGPFTLKALHRMWEVGAVNAATRYCGDESTEWEPLGKLIQTPVIHEEERPVRPPRVKYEVGTDEMETEPPIRGVEGIAILLVTLFLMPFSLLLGIVMYSMEKPKRGFRLVIFPFGWFVLIAVSYIILCLLMGWVFKRQ